ncbi:MAG: thiamine diphosphokinase [Lachnospiraceae bacterium]|nr:thiamine diphosphokinase [Lachnospiraceae bacterium]
MKSGKCIVIGAGDLTVGQIAVGEEDMVIAVDGGLTYCDILQIEPDMILGDFDSVSEEGAEAVRMLEKTIPERIVRLPVEKDDTDMLAALKLGLEKGYRDFRIYAGMGGRFDHSYANIQCLLFLKNQGAVGYLVDGDGMILLIQEEEITFRAGMEGYVSLLALGGEAKGVTIKGLKYTLEDGVIRSDFPIGISNEFIGQEARVIVGVGCLVCIISYAV